VVVFSDQGLCARLNLFCAKQKNTIPAFRAIVRLAASDLSSLSSADSYFNKMH